MSPRVEQWDNRCHEKSLHDKQKVKLYLHCVSIVNGAQTTGAIDAAALNMPRTFPSRQSDDRSESRDELENRLWGDTQNSSSCRHRRSNYPVQIRMRQDSLGPGVEDVHRRNSSGTNGWLRLRIRWAKCSARFGGDLHTAIRAKVGHLLIGFHRQ